ncbi:uncharacterized protein LOC141614610 [Silene latifolia]|uniref:uncharacterized protein LOC141614610 n=1 Tax=Silene latifolia TaxID=37657 RepID=UPI003D7827D6
MKYNCVSRKSERNFREKLIKEHIGWKPGIESNLNVWDKKWVNSQTPEPKDCLLDESFTFLKDLRVKDICFNTGGWNEGLIRLLFAEESVNQILAIPLSCSRSKDEVFWPFTSSGSYTVKSGYGIIFQEYFNEHGSSKDKDRVHTDWKPFCRKKLWHLPGPQTWKILLWKIIIGSLPVGSEFVKRDLAWDSSCALCGTGRDTLETLDHLFRDCTISSRIWAGSVLGINVGQFPSLDVRTWIVNWIFYLYKLEDGVTLVVHFLAILVSLWNLRNDIVFRGGSFHHVVFFSKTRQMVTDVLQAINKPTNDSLHPPGYGPEEKDNLMDFDGLQMLRMGRPVYSIGVSSSCSMVFGWVVLGTQGDIRYEGSMRGRAESSLQAEALGIRKAIKWARQTSILHLEVSTDCLQLLTQWMGKATMHHHISGIFEEITSLSTAFHCFCFSYVRRNQNTRAHGLAKQAMSLH